MSRRTPPVTTGHGEQIPARGERWGLVVRVQAGNDTRLVVLCGSWRASRWARRRTPRGERWGLVLAGQGGRGPRGEPPGRARRTHASWRELGLVLLGLVGHVRGGRGPRGERCGLVGARPAGHRRTRRRGPRGERWGSCGASRPGTSDARLAVNAGPRGEHPGRLDTGRIDAGLVAHATGLLARPGGPGGAQRAALVAHAGASWCVQACRTRASR
jgi:hypothetical protein